MSQDSIFSPAVASGGTHEQIERFLQTAMRGVMGPHDQEAAAEQIGKPGHPINLPRMPHGLTLCLDLLSHSCDLTAHLRLLSVDWFTSPLSINHTLTNQLLSSPWDCYTGS